MGSRWLEEGFVSTTLHCVIPPRAGAESSSEPTVVVCVVSDGRAKVNSRTLSVLAAMGVYQVRMRVFRGTGNLLLCLPRSGI